MIALFESVDLFPRFLADKRVHRDSRALSIIPCYTSLLAVPFFLIALISNSLIVAFFALAIGYCVANAWHGPYFAALHDLVRPHSRATVTAIQFFLANPIGLGLGPVVVGMMSDHLREQVGFQAGLPCALRSVLLYLFRRWPV
jgi:MFS family permease